MEKPQNAEKLENEFDRLFTAVTGLESHQDKQWINCGPLNLNVRLVGMATNSLMMPGVHGRLKKGEAIHPHPYGLLAVSKDFDAALIGKFYAFGSAEAESDNVAQVLRVSFVNLDGPAYIVQQVAAFRERTLERERQELSRAHERETRLLQEDIAKLTRYVRNLAVLSMIVGSIIIGGIVIVGKKQGEAPAAIEPQKKQPGNQTAVTSVYEDTLSGETFLSIAKKHGLSVDEALFQRDALLESQAPPNIGRRTMTPFQRELFDRIRTFDPDRADGIAKEFDIHR